MIALAGSGLLFRVVGADGHKAQAGQAVELEPPPGDRRERLELPPGAIAVPVPRAARPGRLDAETPAATSKLPVYELTIAGADLAALEKGGDSGSGETYATFAAGGRAYDKVRVRLRGQWSRSWPKKSFKILFEPSAPFNGQTRLNLNSGWRDPAFVREALAYHIYAACGVPASRCQMVRLQVNGHFYGLYVEVEDPDTALVQRLEFKGALVFKTLDNTGEADERDLGDEAAYRVNYSSEKHAPRPAFTNDFAELRAFCERLNRATNDAASVFRQCVDIDRYVNYLAATVLTQNWDCFNKNHYLVRDQSGSRLWFVVPWDLDRTCGDHWEWSFSRSNLPILLGTRQLPGITGWNRMADRFLNEPALRARLRDRLVELLEKEFTTEKLFPLLDRLEAQIGPEAAMDRRRWPNPQAPDLHRGILGIKTYIERRRAFLGSELGKL